MNDEKITVEIFTDRYNMNRIRPAFKNWAFVELEVPGGHGVNRDYLGTVQMKERPIQWPAKYYVYATWGYALIRALALAAEKNQKTYLFSGVINDESVWVVSWDPRKRRV